MIFLKYLIGGFVENENKTNKWNQTQKKKKNDKYFTRS